MTEYLVTTVNFAHANGFPAPAYQRFFDMLRQNSTEAVRVIAKHQYAHDPEYPLVNNWTHQVDELLDFIRNSSDEPIVGVGHSFGAVITYLAACRAPELFKGVVLCDPPLLTGLGGRVFAKLKHTPLIDRITPAGRTRNRKQKWDIQDDVSAYFASKRLFKGFPAESIDDYVSSATQVIDSQRQLSYAVDVEVNIFKTIPTNLHDYYGQCTVPGLLITGAQTNVTLEMFVKPFLQGNPHFAREVIQGTHMFVFEEPHKTAEKINTFIQQLG